MKNFYIVAFGVFLLATALSAPSWGHVYVSEEIPEGYKVYKWRNYPKLFVYEKSSDPVTVTKKYIAHQNIILFIKNSKT